MAEYVPLFRPGQTITRQASADITGGQVVEVSGSGTVAAAGAASAKWLGVAAFDAKTGERVTIETGGVQRPLASGAITAGDNVTTAPNGLVATAAAAAGTAVGIALTTATDGNPVEVAFIR
jgi:predicted RecA/RadA family phage recombinase